MITTDCEGEDVSHFEFAFNCDKGNSVERHSFGFGGFDESEEYDTEVTCLHCDTPSAVQHKASTTHSKKANVSSVKAPASRFRKTNISLAQAGETVRRGKVSTRAKAKFWPFTSRESEAPREINVVRFGPGQCVSTYKSEEGHCIMKTECTDEQVQDFDFGLVCVDKVGRPTRHLFGRGSFDRSETFDTLIQCNECLGLEDVPSNIAVNGQIMVLSNEVRQLRSMMKNITLDVTQLNQQVLGNALPAQPASPAANEVAKVAPDPVPAPAPAPSATPGAALFSQEEFDNQHMSFSSRHADRDSDPEEVTMSHFEPRQARRAHRHRTAIAQEDVEVRQNQQKRRLRHRARRDHFRRHEDDDVDEAEDEDQDERRYRSRAHRRQHGHRRMRHHDEDMDSEDTANNDEDSESTQAGNNDEDSDGARDDSDTQTRAHDEHDNEEQEQEQDDTVDENSADGGVQQDKQEAEVVDDSEVGDGFND